MRLRRGAEHVFEGLRAGLDAARQIRGGRQRLEDIARYFPEGVAIVQGLLDELVREDEASRARERARATRAGRVGR